MRRVTVLTSALWLMMEIMLSGLGYELQKLSLSNRFGPTVHPSQKSNNILSDSRMILEYDGQKKCVSVELIN